MRIRPFGRLFTAYTVNYFGDMAALIALAVLVYDQTGSAVATSGLFVSAQFLPALLAPLLTARLDQRPARRVLPGLYVGEAVLFLGLAVFASDFLLPAVYALVLLDGILLLSARAVTRATVHTVLTPSNDLRAGNGLLNVGFAVSSVAGSALGGVLVGALDPAAVLLLDAATFLVIAGITMSLPTFEVESNASSPTAGRVRQGLQFAKNDRVLRLVLIGETVAIVFFTLIVPIEVIYAKETLETTNAGFGLLLATWSAGVVVGSLIFVGARHTKIARVILLATALIGAAYVGMATTTALALACSFALVGGVGNGIQWVAVMTLVQEATPDAFQARITGLLESAASIATGAGFLLGGVTVALLSPPAAFAIAGGAILLLVALSPFALASRRSVGAEAAADRVHSS